MKIFNTLTLYFHKIFNSKFKGLFNDKSDPR